MKMERHKDLVGEECCFLFRTQKRSSAGAPKLGIGGSKTGNQGEVGIVTKPV